jgi:hypothetical protein
MIILILTQADNVGREQICMQNHKISLEQESSYKIIYTTAHYDYTLSLTVLTTVTHQERKH